ncbi:hypothetical protein B0H14DRAFT_354821 [Mycena olivaceomarginata]|nr:hypothetical protein B0H14DRAFT_354821 [Mycena olivaceomarginata]
MNWLQSTAKPEERDSSASFSRSPPIFSPSSKPCAYFVDGATACGILAACSSVESLACWVDTDAPQLPLLISQLPLRRLSTRVDHFLRIPFGAPPSSYLSGLTHIQLHHWDSSHLSQLAHLPRLTHVCLPARDHTRIRGYIETVCSSCPRLQVLIILCPLTLVGRVEESLPPAAKADPRVVVQAKVTRRKIIEDWEATYAGHLNIWSRAEATVKERLSVGNE